jgi:hypothetical protein
MAKLSALSGAVRKTTGSAKKPAANIIPAADLVNPEGGAVIFSRDQVVEAMEGTAEGKRLEDQGKALQVMHRPTLVQFVQRNMVKQWVSSGRQPENPKLSTNSDGTGTIIGAALVDKAMKMDDNQYQELVSVIGEKQAEANVVHRDEISFNNEKVNQEVEVGGKTRTVLEIVDEAITEAFKKIKREDLLQGLFEVKEVFETKKGLLPNALTLVGGPVPGAQVKMYDLLQAARVITNLKPSGGGAKDD